MERVDDVWLTLYFPGKAGAVGAWVDIVHDGDGDDLPQKRTPTIPIVCWAAAGAWQWP